MMGQAKIKSQKTKMSPAEQFKAFRDAARERVRDDDEKALGRKLKKVATSRAASVKKK